MLENGKRRMNETYLEGIATILKVRPSTLIAEDDDSAGEFLDLFILLDEAHRGQARSYLDFLKSQQDAEVSQALVDESPLEETKIPPKRR